MTESEWQEQVLELAGLYRWHVLHVRKAIGRRDGRRGWQTPTNFAGWPDLFLWHETERRFLALELKVGRNTATLAQLEVLRSLAAAGATVAVVYPSDLEWLADELKPESRSSSTG